MASTTRIALVADIHHGPATKTKRGDAAPRLLDEFLRHTAADKPDLVVDLGDRISDVDPQTDRRLMREVGEAFSSLAIPRLHLGGNHDMHFLDRAANEDALGHSLAHAAHDLGPWRLIAFQPTVEIHRPEGFVPIAAADLDWLAVTLGQSEAPTLVLSHVPVSGHPMTGNFYFENNAQYAAYPNAAAVRDLLRVTVAPVAWLSGHVHWNSLMQVDGVPHTTQQSLTESFTTGGEPAGAHSTLTLSADGLALTVHGRDPFHVRLPLPRQGPERWRRPMRAFDAAD